MAGCLFASVLFAGAVATGSTPQDHPPGVHALAIAAVERSPQFTIFDYVAVDLVDRVITLRGKVTAPDKKHALERAVAAAAAGHHVVNQLTVLRASAADQELRTRVARAIYGHPAFWEYSVMPNPPIHILVEEDQVTLVGRVRTDADRTLARALASQVGPGRVHADLLTAGHQLERVR